MPTITANGTTLYYELRGDGPPLMFISGGPGDAGFWPEVADALADEYTVLSYDRRGNSRSPRPEHWTEAPTDEQADDAAALLEALGLAPAVVHGHSAGGIILANLALRRPDVLRGAVFHEPAFVVTPGAQETFAALQERLGAAMAQGGLSRAMEMFLRWADGDAGYESLDPDFRERMLGDGEVLFGLEMRSALSSMPTSDQLASIAVPCVVVAGRENRDPAATHHWAYEAAQWAAEALDAPLVEMPGAHGSMITHPEAFVATMRPVLSRLAASQVDA
ncbi:alpha/beta fold hydrolase [Actinomycetospora chibensis]|uniref:Alpha/beta fold hydrolase n=1 Tax=Actinomycetospora chibensis TaxID=663606 RepID=A0ABV9RIL6_9PSEU|nr:alpha/beta fold hydrolase [Actinomycetospora chibensis]MDD7927323.1 alpha/beta fold hydrolase [Actinomycetospora chibensis]